MYLGGSERAMLRKVPDSKCARVKHPKTVRMSWDASVGHGNRDIILGSLTLGCFTSTFPQMGSLSQDSDAPNLEFMAVTGCT